MASPASSVMWPGLAGSILDTLLHVVMGFQCYHYFAYTANSCRDTWWLKLMIGGIVVGEAIIMGVDIVWIYDALINHHMRILSFEPKYYPTDPASVGIVAALLHMYIVSRIRPLTSSVWIPRVIKCMSLCSLLGGIGTSVALHFVFDSFDTHLFNVVVVIWLAFALACDTIVAMSFSANLMRRRTGFVQIKHLLNKVAALTMANGLFVMLVVANNLISFFAAPSASYSVSYLSFSSLYNSSMMCAFNLRPFIRQSIAASAVPRQATSSRTDSDKGKSSLLLVESKATADTDEKKEDVEWAAGTRTSLSESEKLPIKA